MLQNRLHQPTRIVAAFRAAQKILPLAQFKIRYFELMQIVGFAYLPINNAAKRLHDIVGIKKIGK